MHKPFDDEIENKKYESLYNTISNKLDKMILSTDSEIMRYMEIVCSTLLLEINKKFSEPNYSIYLTSRVKSSKSNIAKLEDYTKRLKETDSSISIKDILDLFGLRIIVEKIPHNVTIDPKNPEYETLKMLADERRENIKISEKNHAFESKIDNQNCTSFEYYTKSKQLLQDILNIFESETEYSKNYALDLKEKYNKLINECNKKISILTALGDYSTKMNLSSLEQDSNPQKIDFKELLKDFDSRIDSKLGLKLYSSTLPEIVKNSKQLQALGVIMNPDSSATKIKREKSGYVADFSGLYSNVLNIPIELQTMFVNEHQESIIGYSAHSNMPGKEANFMEVPSAYATRNMKIINNIGKSTFISNEELSLFNMICDIRKGNKDFNKKYTKLLKYLASPENVVLENNSPIGINLDSKLQNDINKFCSLTKKESEELKLRLYKKGCEIYNAWAENISAKHATARLDKDSSAKNRIKIHYDDPYECLAHSIREQIENHNPDSIDAEYYLKNIYINQNDLLKASGLMASESSVIDFEIDEYIKNELPNLRDKVNKYNSIEDDNELEKD